MNDILNTAWLHTNAYRGKCWHIIEDNINEKPKQDLDKKYKGSNKKQQKSRCKPNHSREFHKRVENLSHANFNENEINLLTTGLQ
jgi:hypothetical protein